MLNCCVNAFLCSVLVNNTINDSFSADCIGETSGIWQYFLFLGLFYWSKCQQWYSLQKRYNSSICLKFFHIHIYVSTQMMCLCVYSMIFYIYIYNSHVNHPLLFGGWAWVLLQWPKVACYNVKDNVNYKELILKNACLHIK